MTEEQLRALRDKMEAIGRDALLSALNATDIQLVAENRGRHAVVRELAAFLKEMFSEPSTDTGDGNGELKMYVPDTSKIQW